MRRQTRRITVIMPMVVLAVVLIPNVSHNAYHSYCDRTLLTFGCRLGSQGGPGQASWGSCALECSVYSSQQTAVCCVYIVLASVDQLGLTQVESSLDC